MFRKVKYEVRKDSLPHIDEITSLRLLKNDWEVEDTANQVVKGFIQLIKVSPLKVICFTEAGVRLWHNVIKDDAVSWDATGGIIKTKLTTTKILYYEIVVSSKSVSTPVAFMISEVHTQSAVEELLTELRCKEKEIFRTNTTPVQINSDRSIVLLKAGMDIFNGDTMNMYLSRCWKIVTGRADSKDLNFCTIRACKSHLMKQASNICKQQYIQKDKRYTFSMYVFSILLNAKTLAQASDIVSAACFVFGSKGNSHKVKVLARRAVSRPAPP